LLLTPSQVIMSLVTPTTYVCIASALFASYYGTKYVDAPEKTRNCHCCCHRIHLKISLLIIGIYVTYFVFDGFDDIYVKAAF
jgi:hypothetical protein